MFGRKERTQLFKCTRWPFCWTFFFVSCRTNQSLWLRLHIKSVTLFVLLKATQKTTIHVLIVRECMKPASEVKLSAQNLLKLSQPVPLGPGDRFAYSGPDRNCETRGRAENGWDRSLSQLVWSWYDLTYVKELLAYWFRLFYNLCFIFSLSHS